ncbi:Squalene epoxidase, partial [Dimargaris verticillata]
RDLSEPDRIVGELMQPGGIQALQKLGLEDCVENIDGVTNHGYLVYQEGKQVKLDYPINLSTGRPYTGKSFHHGRFVDKLRRACGAVKRITVKEGMVNNLIVHPLLDRVIGAVYTPAQASDASNDKPSPVPVIAPITVVANGGSSKFR